MAWIRSQNGKIFIDANMLYVEGGILKACVGSDWEKGGRLIGRFSTEERAIAELNKIQKWVDEKQPRVPYQVTQP